MTYETVAKKMIIDCLKVQDGPITRKHLASLVGIKDDRTCRELVAEIVTEGKCPIVTSSDCENGGYYIAKTIQDGEIAAREVEHRIQALQMRLRGFKNAIAIWFGQERLFEEKEAPAVDYKSRMAECRAVLAKKEEVAINPQVELENATKAFLEANKTILKEG